MEGGDVLLELDVLPEPELSTAAVLDPPPPPQADRALTAGRVSKDFWMKRRLEGIMNTLQEMGMARLNQGVSRTG